MNLSRNFTLSELIKSDTAIRKGIKNNPNASMCFHWKSLLRQIRIVGILNKVEDKTDDETLHLMFYPPSKRFYNYKDLLIYVK